MSIFQTTDEFFSWRSTDAIGNNTPFPFPMNDVAPADLRVGDVFIRCYTYETHDTYHLKKVIKINKKTVVVHTCTSHGIRLVALALEKLPLQEDRPYRVIDFYAQ